MGIARNRAIDLLRSRQHQARLREGETLESPDHQGHLVQQDSSEAILLRQVIRDALTALPTAQRQTLELAYYDGLSQAEIAQKMDTPLGTVKTRMREALERLRRRLRPLLIDAAPADKNHK